MPGPFKINIPFIIFCVVSNLSFLVSIAERKHNSSPKACCTLLLDIFISISWVSIMLFSYAVNECQSDRQSLVTSFFFWFSDPYSCDNLDALHNHTCRLYSRHQKQFYSHCFPKMMTLLIDNHCFFQIGITCILSLIMYVSTKSCSCNFDFNWNINFM